MNEKKNNRCSMNEKHKSSTSKNYARDHNI